MELNQFASSFSSDLPSFLWLWWLSSFLFVFYDLLILSSMAGSESGVVGCLKRAFRGVLAAIATFSFAVCVLIVAFFCLLVPLFGSRSPHWRLSLCPSPVVCLLTRVGLEGGLRRQEYFGTRCCSFQFPCKPDSFSFSVFLKQDRFRSYRGSHQLLLFGVPMCRVEKTFFWLVYFSIPWVQMNFDPL